MWAIQAKHLTQKPPRSGANDRPANFSAGDHAQSRAGLGRKFHPIGDQASSYNSVSVLLDSGELRAALQAHGIGKLKRPGRWSGHSAAFRSNRGEALAARAAAAGDDGLALPGRIALEKTMLPNAADSRRLVCAFHNSLNLVVGFPRLSVRLRIHWRNPEKIERERISAKKGVSSAPEPDF